MRIRREGAGGASAFVQRKGLATARARGRVQS